MPSLARLLLILAALAVPTSLLQAQGAAATKSRGTAPSRPTGNRITTIS